MRILTDILLLLLILITLIPLIVNLTKLTKIKNENYKKNKEKPIKINNEKIKEKPKISNKQLLLKQIENIKKELNKLEYGSPKWEEIKIELNEKLYELNNLNKLKKQDKNY